MKKSTIRSLVFIPIVVFIGACATHEVAPPNPEVQQKLQAIDRSQSAVMVVYRPSEAFGSALRPTVVLDGKDLVNIGNGEVFVSAISPGSYVFEMDNKKSGTQITLKPGDDVYLKIEIVPGAWKGSGKLTQVAPQQGGYEATRLELISTREIEIPAYQAAGKVPEKTPPINSARKGADGLRR
jgi:hypothetical protein